MTGRSWRSRENNSPYGAILPTLKLATAAASLLSIIEEPKIRNRFMKVLLDKENVS